MKNLAFEFSSSGLVNVNQLQGGVIFEGDAQITRYGLKHFGEFLKSISDLDFHLVRLGGLKVTSGRSGQTINWYSSLRNHFFSDIVHSLKENLLQFFDFEPAVVRGWLGGSHAYWVSCQAIEILVENEVGFLNAIDDYFKTISWNTNWVGRTRQDFFIQKEHTSLIDTIGR